MLDDSARTAKPLGCSECERKVVYCYGLNEGVDKIAEDSVSAKRSREESL